MSIYDEISFLLRKSRGRDRIRPDRIIQALVDFGWKPDVARAMIDKYPTEYSEDESGNAAGWFRPYAPSGSGIHTGVYVAEEGRNRAENFPRDLDFLLQHEYQHGIDTDYTSVGFRPEEYLRDIERATLGNPRRDRILNSLNYPVQNSDVWHYPHYPANSIDFDYESLPEDFTSKWYPQIDRRPNVAGSIRQAEFATKELFPDYPDPGYLGSGMAEDEYFRRQPIVDTTNEPRPDGLQQGVSEDSILGVEQYDPSYQEFARRLGIDIGKYIGVE